MRRWISFVVLLVGCRFEHGAAPPDGAALPADAAPLPCARSRVWAADFSADPTTLNANGDPVLDWRIRDGGALPGQLADGIWAIAGGPAVALDTQPKADFNRPSRATVRMRNTTSGGSRGVLVSMNVDYSRTTFMPLYLELRLDADEQHQTATLYGKDATTELVLASFAGLSTGLVDLQLDVDPMQDAVTVTVGADSSTHAYTPIPRDGNDDRFATIAVYSDAELDSARFELCQ